MKCSRLRCTRSVDPSRRKYGLCRKHWDAAQIPAQRVDAGPAQAHVAALLALRWSYSAISLRTGLSRATVRDTRVVAKVQRSTEAAILSVPLIHYAGKNVLVDATGTRRRIEALAYLGHPLNSYEHRLGRCRGRVGKAVASGWVSAHIAAAMKRVYKELENTIGPSDLARKRALKRGFSGPAAWDGRDMDDPQARPLAPYSAVGRAA